MKTCKKCLKKFPSSMMMDGVRRTFSSRKYCLECSPFKGKNTRKLEKQKREAPSKILCPSCLEEKPPSAFYVRSDGRPSGYCKACNTKKVVERQKEIKVQCVEYKGGKCEECGYSNCMAALQFHHRNPEGKDFQISSKNKLSLDNLKDELDKCDLLCSRCHAEAHSGLLPQYLKPKPADDLNYVCETMVCTDCGLSLPNSHFYTGFTAYCKKCCNKRSLESQHRTKRRLVEYKGGECQVCGYNRCISALQFHHLDPGTKDFSISSLKNSSLAKALPEIDKCALLCVRCHQEVHAGMHNDLVDDLLKQMHERNLDSHSASSP